MTRSIRCQTWSKKMSTLKVPVNARDHKRGGESASVTLVEYGDYQCPFCALANPVVRSLESQYGQKLCVVFRHFPLVEVHPLAASSAEATEYAGDQGVFWDMHDAIFLNQHRLSMQLLFAIAGTLKLSQIALRESIARSLHADKIQADFIGGVRSGVNGTPTFFVNGLRHQGGFSARELGMSIQEAMDASPSAV
ncbi:protein-disulfide isomerase [Agrobacterium larrymoorei]|uniref:Protein-disulfide isomerase n=1 Tax=Agrobacterium larrymoorei TaxID=160699 RepID=A0AAJ2B7S1_9HYPH|nr:DsbA family protein [Agrobacterium larrymoorei]MDR6100966.1 protein-disulfide isomerase [Agrobacterium larrymoorei]